MSFVLFEEDVMNRNYYIFKSGTLQRKDNNIRVVTEDKIKKDIPCETIRREIGRASCRERV